MNASVQIRALDKQAELIHGRKRLNVIHEAGFRVFVVAARISDRLRHAFPWRDELRVIALLVVPLQRLAYEIPVKLQKQRAIARGQLRWVIVVVGMVPVHMLLQQRSGEIRN
ncbi:hypothetical protein [Paenibacillus silvisoli]|uniref:hypothetical protein n=1 Tax=Paenibacillus silvisoli TaxID=3110539 RepID=UPI002803C3D0|nr:hypothetical protein [Paenibacillus silvisoli]